MTERKVNFSGVLIAIDVFKDTPFASFRSLEAFRIRECFEVERGLDAFRGCVIEVTKPRAHRGFNLLEVLTL